MKRMIAGIGALLTLFLSCTRPDPLPAGTMREMVFRSYSDPAAATRTGLDADGKTVLWQESDAIGVFDKASGANHRFVNSGAAGKVALFSGMAPVDDYYYALYPYQADAAIEDEGESLVATLPSVQTAVAGSFGSEANLAVAATAAGGDLYFRNVGALLSFDFSSSHRIVSVRISASGTPMSGRVTMMTDDLAAPSVEAYGEDSYDFVELSGTFEAGQTYYAVVLPGNYGALKVVFTDSEGATAAFSNPFSLYLDRNDNVRLGSFTIPESKWVTPASGDYVKVDKSYDDWSGHYLIVADGSSAYAADGVVGSKWLEPKPVTVSDGRIARTDVTREYEAVIEKIEGTDHYSIRFANGQYLGSSDSNDGIKTTGARPSAADTDFQWTFSFEEPLVRIALARNPSRILRLNGTSGFRTYASSTGTQATLFRGPSGGGQEETAITSSSVLSRNTTSARLTASFQSVTSAPSSGGFKYGPDESLGSTVRSTDITGTSGTFTAELGGLQVGTLYYYQPFIVVDGVTYLGTRKSFRTESSSPGSGGRGWFELPAQKDADGNGIDDENPDYYYSWTMRADVPSVRNFSACYSKGMRHPVWVAAPMHSSYKGNSGRNEKYQNDPSISCEQSAKFSGYTRGHMLGSSDRTVSVPTNQQVFYYSNIGAQLQSGFNTGGGAWNNLESLVDGQWCADTLYQVIGCIFETFTTRDGGTTIRKQTGTNAAGKSFQVPTAWYKVLLRTKSGSTGKPVNECSADELKCVGFILPHTSRQGYKPGRKDMYSVKEVEDLTGLTFFVNVPDAPKDSFSASDWGF